MRAVDIDKAMELVAKDPVALARYDYIIDEGGWFVPTCEFLDWLRQNRPATARALGVKE